MNDDQCKQSNEAHDVLSYIFTTTIYHYGKYPPNINAVITSEFFSYSVCCKVVWCCCRIVTSLPIAGSPSYAMIIMTCFVLTTDAGVANADLPFNNM
jgi:hypothetical protein